MKYGGDPSKWQLADMNRRLTKLEHRIDRWQRQLEKVSIRLGRIEAVVDISAFLEND